LIAPCRGGFLFSCLSVFLFFFLSAELLFHDGAHHEQIQWLHLKFEAANGQINEPVNFTIRDRLAELKVLASQLVESPTRIGAPSPFLEVLRRFEEAFGSGPAFGARSASNLAQEARFGNHTAPALSVLPAHHTTQRTAPATHAGTGPGDSKPRANFFLPPTTKRGPIARTTLVAR
jgi:hypothetical protein